MCDRCLHVGSERMYLQYFLQQVFYHNRHPIVSRKSLPVAVGRDGSHMVRMNTHPVKKLETDRQTRIGKSPCVQRSCSSIGTARVARANMRWRRERVRGKE